MPRVKSAKSLTSICMDFILENEEIYSERFPIGGHALRELPAVNPFDNLPTELVEELIKFLRKKETYRCDDQRHSYPRKTYKITPLFKLLMTPRLRTLDLTKIKKECISDISNVLHLATTKCRQLETLRLDDTAHQYVSNFNFIIPKFSKLRILDIFLPERGDECFGLIGKHCPDLRELTCIDCIELTDDGIFRLCVDGNCKCIRLLVLNGGNKITTKGIQLALDNLPQLRVLWHKSLLQCLAEIAETAINLKLILPKYSLTALFILYCTVYKSGYLQQSVLLCPNVTRVYLKMLHKERFDDAELLSLLSLEKLETIEITHAEFEQHSKTPETRIDRGLTFDGVIPLLRKFGHHLKKLSFDGFYLIDISTIIEFCINLESLNIFNCKICPSTETTATEMPVLHHLKRLYLRYLTFELFPLLSSPSLSHLNILSCDGLTDKVLQRAASLHSFRNLEYLHFGECHSVTKKGIDIFLKESNPLRKIILSFNHPGISRKDYIDWNENAIWIEKNWQFKFILKRDAGNMYIGELDIKDFGPEYSELDLLRLYHRYFLNGRLRVGVE